MTARRVQLQGCLNFRDLGGHPTTDGTVVRRGCLYRSGELCSLTDDDLRALTGLGIRVVVDLRNEWERAARPNRLPPAIELVERVAPSSDGGVGKTFEELVATGDLPVRDDAYFTDVYIGLLERLAPDIRRVVELAVGAPQRPVLFHCAAGKDRTGVVAAIVLGLLHVPDESIIEDYELTTTHYAAPAVQALGGLLEENGLTYGDVAHLFEARTAVLVATLRHLHETWGGYDGYAVRELDLPPGLPAQLRAALTSPARHERRPAPR